MPYIPQQYLLFGEVKISITRKAKRCANDYSGQQKKQRHHVTPLCTWIGSMVFYSHCAEFTMFTIDFTILIPSKTGCESSLRPQIYTL
jgi:hypothetical protein